MLLFAHITLYLNRRQKLRGILFALLTRYAVLDAYIKRVKRVLTFGQSAPLSVTNELSTLTRRARRIYAEFKVSKENKDNEDAS